MKRRPGAGGGDGVRGGRARRVDAAVPGAVRRVPAVAVADVPQREERRVPGYERDLPTGVRNGGTGRCQHSTTQRSGQKRRPGLAWGLWLQTGSAVSCFTKGPVGVGDVACATWLFEPQYAREQSCGEGGVDE